MKCLHCGNEMTNYTVHNMLGRCSYDVCEACHGLWLDRNELDKLAYQTNDGGSIEHCSNDALDDPNTGHTCPRCSTPLYRVGFLGRADIALEKCDDCNGFWLDGGELQKIDAELVRIYKGQATKSAMGEFVLNGHLPRFGFASKRKSDAADFSATVLPVDHAKFIQATDSKCPSCGCALDAYDAYGTPLKACPQCHGMWLEKDEIRHLRNKLADRQDEPLRWMNDEIKAIETTHAWATNKVCPACATGTLFATYFSDSEIGLCWCKTCHGIWLEHKDFEAIETYQKYEFDHLSHTEMIEKAKKAFGNIVADGSESNLEKIKDAYSAMRALGFVYVFEHPALEKQLLKLIAASAYI